MVLNLSTSAWAQPEYVYRMISAARGQDEPAQPVCSSALLFVWLLMTGAHAFMYWIDFGPYLASPDIYQARALPYAASASWRSSVQPLSGFEYDPHSTVARG